MILDSTISAVVTGGASGLGAATARALAAKGVKVAIFDLQAEKGEAVAAEIGGVFCEVNVTSDESVAAGFEKARAAHGQERVLVNCAGTGAAMKTASRSKEDGSIKFYPPSAFDWLIQINLVGTFRCIAMSAAGMMALDPMNADGARGAIVNTASVAGEDGQIGQVAYSASKAGVIGMTLPIARDLMSEGIRVNTILPGIFETPLMMGALQNVKDALAASVPFPKRLGKPEEYANLALTMIENDYFNGEDVRLALHRDELLAVDVGGGELVHGLDLAGVHPGHAHRGAPAVEDRALRLRGHALQALGHAEEARTVLGVPLPLALLQHAHGTLGAEHVVVDRGLDLEHLDAGVAEHLALTPVAGVELGLLLVHEAA